MTTFALSSLRPLVADALENKYEGFSEGALNRALVEAWDLAKDASNERALSALLRPPDRPSTDAANHVIVLHLLERFWSRANLKRPITHIHQAIYGVSDDHLQMRRAEYVGDYGGLVPTELPDVKGALNELELLVERLTPGFRNQAVELQAVYLAHLFSSIIRVHPFEDGNGRTARFVVQYCLRMWGKPYMPIPKVRNVPTWRMALESAIAGDIGSLVEEFVCRTKPSAAPDGTRAILKREPKTEIDRR